MRVVWSFLLVLIMALAACGGEGNSSGGGGPPTANAPSVSFAASSTTVDGGETVVFSVSATGSAGGAIDASISCTGGRLTDAVFLLTDPVEQVTEITCTASASDGGQTASKSITITVNPPATGLALFDEYQQAVAQGEYVMVAAQNLPLTDGSLKVTLGNSQIDAQAVADGVVAARIPLDAATGQQRLILEAGGKRFDQTITVNATNVSGSARGVVADYLAFADEKVADLLARSDLSSGQRSDLEALRSEIATQISGLDSLSADVLQQAARTLVANDLHLVGAKYPSACSSNPARAIEAAFTTGVGVAMVALGEPVPPVLVAGGVITLVGALATLDLIDNVEDCFGIDDMSIEAPADFNRGRRPAAVTAEPLSIDFINGRAKSVRVVLERTLLDELGDTFPKIVALLDAAAGYVPFLSDETEAKIARLANGQSVTADPAGLAVALVDGDDMTIAASGSGNELVLTVSDPSPENTRQDFSFTITRGDFTKAFSAVLVTQEPIAFDIATEAYEFSTVRIALAAEGAESYEIVRQPAVGTVSIDQATGEAIFALTQNDGSPITFEFVAINEYGRSEPATVLVTPIRDFTGDWEVEVAEVLTAGDTSFCEPRSYLVQGRVRPLSETEYRFTFQVLGVDIASEIDLRETRFTLQDGSTLIGLLGSTTLSVGIDEGTSTIRPTVIMANRNSLGIVGDWLYKSNDGNCAGRLATVSSKRSDP